MRCPRCGFSDSKVADTRLTQDAESIRRRRVCFSCCHRFFTVEIVCAEYPIVVKRDGREEEFDKNKIKAGMIKAFKKCVESEAKVDQILAKVLTEITSKYCEKISSEKIGIIVMDALRNADEVAYLRFASIYKNFETANDFVSEFDKISKSGKEE